MNLSRKPSLRVLPFIESATGGRESKLVRRLVQKARRLETLSPACAEHVEFLIDAMLEVHEHESGNG
jgi:hypothetical protein